MTSSLKDVRDDPIASILGRRMPTTRAERVTALVGLALLLLLLGLAASLWIDYSRTEPRATNSGATLATAPPAAPVAERTTSVATERRVVAPSAAELELVATRGDCWLEVRIGNADGRVVFAGILAQGQTRRFTARRLWIQLGAPDVLDAQLNDRPVADLPDATATVVATAAGIRLVGAS